MSREAEYVDRLQRRLAHLKARVAGKPHLTWDLCEIKALQFALDCIDRQCAAQRRKAMECSNEAMSQPASESKEVLAVADLARGMGEYFRTCDPRDLAYIRTILVRAYLQGMSDLLNEEITALRMGKGPLE